MHSPMFALAHAVAKQCATRTALEAKGQSAILTPCLRHCRTNRFSRFVHTIARSVLQCTKLKK